MTSKRIRNDRPQASSRAGAPGAPGEKWSPEGSTPDRRNRPARPREDGDAWVWGWHAVTAALANPGREPPTRLMVAPDKLEQAESKLGLHRATLRAEPYDMNDIARMLPSGASHQGVALRVPPPASTALEDLAAEPGVIVMLDQITDPQNIGAVFRSAAAFGARGVILQDRHAPALGGVIAKASAGAIDAIPHARVTNLSRALETLDGLGWRAVGLDGAAPAPLDATLDRRPTVLVLGSEGEGLRRLVAEHCDALAHIAMPGGFESLNVSAAAAIALYEASRAQRRAAAADA
jgi:23S rRNA (guanosine2251-2'-O)-methyltransferase